MSVAANVLTSGNRDRRSVQSQQNTAAAITTAIKAIETGCLPPTINYETADPDCDLDYIPNTVRSARINAVLSNSMGFGGHNVALVFARY